MNASAVWRNRSSSSALPVAIVIHKAADNSGLRQNDSVLRVGNLECEDIGSARGICGPARRRTRYLRGMNARALFAFIGITNWLAPAS